MKIYLVSPRNPESFWTFDRILPTMGKNCVYPNLSMPTVAGLTPREHEIVLCDENVGEIDFDTDADIVGVTGYLIHRARILEILEAFEKHGKFVVIGGPYATLCPEELTGRADVVFSGEAEDTWPRFLEEYAAGTWSASYVTPDKPSLHGRPMPRFDLLDTAAYRTMTVQFGRGCPYSCEFCDIIIMYGRKPRTKTVDQMMEEIEEVHRLGAATVFIVDDNFIGNRRLAKDLLRALGDWQRRRGFPLELMTEVTLNVAEDEELLELLRSANFCTVFVGIESPRAASLRETKKTQNLRSDMRQAVRRIQTAGIEVMAGMIVGFDHDDQEIFREHFEFIQESGIAVSMTGMLNALPKTPLFDRLTREGRIVSETIGDQFVVTNVVPQLMSSRELYQGYGRLLHELYEPENFRRRANTMIANLGTREGSAIPTRSQIATAIRFLMGILSFREPARSRMALRLLFETLVRRPSALGTAIALALMHEHLHGYVDTVRRHLRKIEAGLECASVSPAESEAAHN